MTDFIADTTDIDLAALGLEGSSNGGVWPNSAGGLSELPEGIIGTSGNDVLFGTSGIDTIEGLEGDDDLRGSLNDDLLYGGNGADTLYGQKGNDLLKAGKGNDTLSGGKGKDKLFGYDGDDVLDGGVGRDVLKGGAGADTFIFSDNYGSDVVKDFEDDIDSIVLDANLWGGGLTVSQMLSTYASVDAGNGDIVIDFGGGHSLRIKNETDFNILLDDIEIV